MIGSETRGVARGAAGRVDGACRGTCGKLACNRLAERRRQWLPRLERLVAERPDQQQPQVGHGAREKLKQA